MPKNRKGDKPTGDGLRMTKVGFWFLIFGLVVLVAASNTGNNGLYLALAMMGGVLIASHFLAGRNVRGLRVSLGPLPEIYVNRPCSLALRLQASRRWLPRFMLAAAVGRGDIEVAGEPEACRVAPCLFPRVEWGESEGRQVELLASRRGRLPLRDVHIVSLFPFGLFRKGARYPVSAELLVYPEIFQPSVANPEHTGKSGHELARFQGWGHDLFGLRKFRDGDDPRDIHWKQTARLGKLIFKERETEESRRLTIVFDNAVGDLTDAAASRFEHLVSEAATAAVDSLQRGHEVELVTRDTFLPFSSGLRQRRAILETLALIEPLPLSPQPLKLRDPTMPHLRLAMEPSSGVGLADSALAVEVGG